MRIFISVLIFSVVLDAKAQWAVKFWGTNSIGVPIYQPIDWQQTTNIPQGYVAMTTAQLNDCVSTNAAAYAVYAAAQPGVITANSNAWYSMYLQIPQGITDSSNRIVNLGNLLASFNSGTNNAAGTNSIIKQTMQHVQVSYQYLNQIIVYLSRLGPGLQQVYQPANDPVGH